VRSFVLSFHPALELYISPVNIDPLDSAMPISEPTSFARELADRHGRFYTLGIPEDTKAFTHGALPAEAFIDQAALAGGERLKLWRAALAEFRAGCLCFYFGASDLMQHMFWRDFDTEHPAHDAEEAARHGAIVPEQYEQADARVGEALAVLREGDTLLVFSDHGFTSFRQGFSLNSWLVEQGYLHLVDPSGRNHSSDAASEAMFAGIDWGYSQAYGLGMNGLYLNQQGREKFGSVKPAENKALCERLREELLQVRDAEGKPVFDRVDRTFELYPGANSRLAPDLILGYADGFRASWETVLGGMPGETLVTNREQWSGEHLISARLVPGVLVSNRKLNTTDPHLRDLAPTILQLFGLKPIAAMTGKPLIITS
jgi:predicted AlkP superfamily phosphohydrolase/phosphomutase